MSILTVTLYIIRSDIAWGVYCVHNSLKCIACSAVAASEWVLSTLRRKNGLKYNNKITLCRRYVYIYIYIYKKIYESI